MEMLPVLRLSEETQLRGVTDTVKTEIVARMLERHISFSAACKAVGISYSRAYHAQGSRQIPTSRDLASR
jgi:hypothetical protein